MDQQRYREHLLIWFLHHETWPTGQIDHRDRNKKNNRIENLRLATNSQNAQNQKCRSDSSTGVKGVSATGKTFAARVAAGGKRIQVYGFETIALAKEFRDLMAIMIHGEFYAE
jgi:hypothetical protein